jgi:hypothetical protein
MIPAIQSALNAILGGVATLQNANGAGRIFELFIMTGVAARLQNLGFDVWLQRSDGTRINSGDADRRFIQRGGAPTGVQSATAGPDNASVIGFQRSPNRRRWEIWNGIQFRGRSNALHEIDIAVVPWEIGDALRQAGGYPQGRPRVAIECKDVGQAGSLDEMRAFVARLYDLTVLYSHRNYLNFPTPVPVISPGNLGPNPFYTARVTYWQENRRTFDAIARRTGFVTGAAPMTDYYDIEPHDSVTATSTEAADLMNAVADWIYTRFP